MLKNIEGQRIPHVTLRTRVGGQWREVATEELFANKRAVVFALPGAFTPTCSSAHVPRYNDLAPSFKSRGIDAIYCISVNDAFVMEQWAKDQSASEVMFLPDGNGELTAALGMLVDKRSLGFGKRSWRYSMLVENGVIKKMFIEPEVDGDPFDVSDADTMLKYLDPAARTPPDVLLFTKPGCGHCDRAKRLLAEHQWAYEELPASPRRLRAVAGASTTPQVFIDGQHIGGADELEAYFANAS